MIINLIDKKIILIKYHKDNYLLSIIIMNHLHMNSFLLIFNKKIIKISVIIIMKVV